MLIELLENILEYNSSNSNKEFEFKESIILTHRYLWKLSISDKYELQKLKEYFCHSKSMYGLPTDVFIVTTRILLTTPSLLQSKDYELDKKLIQMMKFYCNPLEEGHVEKIIVEEGLSGSLDVERVVRKCKKIK